ncbi:MAG: SURF1 family protein [Gammaproteobacteria bacterium]|nr:SURF1 family protein [Gammaproteobacteria bacterium]
MAFTLRFGKIHFSTTWIRLALGLVGLGFLMSLSVWQVHRAAEKRTMLTAFHQHAKSTPVELTALMQPSQYQRITLTGHYEAPQFLLDNQFYQHVWGYHVLTPFRLLDGKTVVMVNRGWVKGALSRDQLPEVPLPVGQQTVVGGVYYPSYNAWIQQPELSASLTGVIVVEQFLPQLFEKFLHQPAAPFMMRLDPAMSYGWHRDWQVVVMSPERHIAYAIQWGALAILFCVVFVSIQVKRVRRVD